MSTLSQFSSGIKSVQRGVGVSSGGVVNITVTSVNTTKAFLNFFSSLGRDTLGNDGIATATLSSATNIAVSVPGADSRSLAYSWELVEFN